MKRLFVLLIFSFAFIANALAQFTVTDTCSFGGDTIIYSITSTSLICNSDNSGTATVSIIKGTAPYTFTWFNGQTTATATGLSPGNKSVQIDDANLQFFCTGFIDIAEPAGISISLTPAPKTPSCFGLCDGSANASPSGGTGTYTYNWAPSGQTTQFASGLCNGTQTITVNDANGCIKKVQFNITQPPLLVVTGSATSITCAGFCNGQANATPNGGTSPYTYSWSNGATTSTISNLCPNTYTCYVADSKTCTATYITTITEPSPLTVMVSGANLTCNSVCTGSVTATPSGGIGAYTYSWAPGGYSTPTVTGLCAGTYTLTLRDANACLKTETITLTQPTAITTTMSGTNVNCFSQCDGTASVTAGGGSPGYSYSWSTGASTSAVTGLCNQTYTVTTTDANSCTNQNTVTITEPPLLTVTPSKTDETCPGSCNGSLSAAAAGGTPPYTYNWSSGCTTSACASICSSNYSITITDSKGCTATGTVTVSSPPAIVPNLSSTAALCFGNCNGTATSNTTGGVAPYTYSWSGGCVTSACSNLCAGNYTVTITDATGCIMTGTVAVTQPPLFTASIASANPNPLNCNGDCNGTALASLNGGVPGQTYLWSNGGTNSSITGLCAGGYTLTATDGNGCTANTSVTFTQPPVLTATLVVGNASCSFGCDGSVSATAGGGTSPYTYSWLPGGQTTSSITGLCEGDYSITLQDSKGCSYTQSVTITAPSAVAATFTVNNISCSGLCDGSATATPSGGTGAYTYTWAGGQTTQTATGFCAGLHNILINDANGCASPLYAVNVTQPSVLSSFVSSSVSSCGSCNGSATLTTSGGTTPYSYSWSPGGQTTSTATGLCVGNYTVSVLDANNCVTTVTVAISSQINVVMSVSGPGVSCAGTCDAAANASPSGGATPYTYAWAPGGQTTSTATGLCGSTYTVTITDAGGCTTTRTVSFSAPAAITSTINATSSSCGSCNGSAAASAAGGTGALTYSWSGFPVQTTPTAIGLCAGNYTVTIADANNCTTTNTVAIGTVPVISDNPSTTLAACGGTDGAICVAPSGGSGAYTYLWAPSGETISCITGLGAGIYTVTITDAIGCSDDFPIALSTSSGPTLTVTSATDPTCNAGCDGAISVSAVGSDPPFDYWWSPGSQTTTAIAALCAGTYIIQVNDAAVTPCTTFASITLNNPLQLIANPVITDVSCPSGNNGSICLSPTGGTSPYTYEWLPGGQTTSCRAALSTGSYSVVIADAAGCDDTLLIPISEPATLSVTITSTNATCSGNSNGTATANVNGGTTLYTYSWSTGSALPGIVGLVPGNYSITVTDGNGCIATASVAITEPAVLTNTLTSTNMSCNSVCDGTAIITGSGGTTAYTYFWSPGGETTSAISGLCQGNYAVTLSDANGCTSTNTTLISQPTGISATVTPANASCFSGCNGSASASASGGTGAFTYNWNPGALTGPTVTGLCVGSYTLTTSDANGCTTTNVFSIAAPAVLQANITSTITTCVASCDGMASSSPVGGTGAYTFLWSNGQTTATATGLCGGTHTLTLTDGNGCTITQTTNVGSPFGFTQSSAVSGATCNLCNGSITVVGSGGTAPYSYFWSTGATTGTVTGLCAGVYIDTVMDAKGCISVDTIALSNTTGPTITVGSTSVTCNGACDGTATVLTAVGDGAPWIYTWIFASGSQTTQTVTGLCANQYFSQVTDTLGCITIDNINITEPAVLAPNVAITNATCFGICDGSIVANASGGTGAYTYAWLPGGQTTSSISAQCAGNYTLTLKDANNCSNTATITIGQNTILSTIVTSTNNSCNASCNGTASISISAGTPLYTYAWTGGQSTSTATGLCANGYTVTVNDAIGCLSINTVTITEPAVLISNITSVNPLCNVSCNGSVTAAPTGGTSPYTYLWMPGGLTTSAASGLCANNYTLTLTDANSCAVTNTVTLTDPSVLSSASVVVNASCTNICDGSIDITPAGGTIPYTFIWSPGAQTTEDVSGLCSGNYSVTITDANACAATYTISVGATTVVIAIAGNDTSFCIGGTASLTSTSTNAVSIGWYQLPAWSPLGVTSTINVSPPAGITTYALIATNGICSDTDSVIVTVNNYPVVVVNDTTVCSGSITTLCATGAMAYQWYQLPAWTPIATGTCINVSPPVGVTDFAIIGMNGVCSDTDSVAVTVLAMPIANAVPDTAFCQGGSVMLCGTLSQNGVTFNWFTLPLWTPAGTNTCTIVSPLTTTDYGLIVSNGICSDTDTVSVTIYPIPVANAGPDITVLSSASAVLNGTGGGTYLWSPAAGLSNATIANPTANSTSTTTYALLVTDASGCTDIDSLTVTIIHEVKPNDGLSPNDDGINDVWVIPNIEQFPTALVEVYNRWGELLFHSIGYTEKWDATYKGKDLPVGTYYFVINLNSDLYPDPITGPITILR